MEESKELYEEKTELLKALSHPLRLQIVRGLLVGDATMSAVWRRAPGSHSPPSPST